MTTWIALFRGINVGGHNKLPMAELRAELEAIGLEDVRSYIQSGNVVFRSAGTDPDALADQIVSEVDDEHGFRPRVLILSADELRSAMNRNPFPEAEAEPKTLHLFFLASAPSSPNLVKIVEVKAESERFELDDRVFYLHTPDGFGTSRLATNVERHLGVEATARNWRTLIKVIELAEA